MKLSGHRNSTLSGLENMPENLFDFYVDIMQNVC